MNTPGFKHLIGGQRNMEGDQADLAKGSQECSEAVCGPCSEEDNLVDADGYCVSCNEFLCPKCISYHRRLKTLKHHNIRGYDEMPKAKSSYQNQAKEGATSNQDEPIIECKQHKGKKIRFFCETHDEVGCNDCITISHRSCAKIMRVEDATDDATVTTELDEFDQRLKTVAGGIKSMLVIVENNRMQVEDSKETLLKHIRQYKETIINTLDKLASKIENQVENKIKEDLSRIDKLMKKCKRLQADIEKTTNDFNILQESNLKTKEFILMNQSKLKMAEWEQDWNEMMARFKQTQYAFLPDENLSEILRNDSEFGQLIAEMKPVERAVVLYSYEAENENELTLIEGEVITILNRDIEDYGWWKALRNDEFGYISSNFVELIDE